MIFEGVLNSDDPERNFTSEEAQETVLVLLSFLANTYTSLDSARLAADDKFEGNQLLYATGMIDGTEECMNQLVDQLKETAGWKRMLKDD